MTSLSMPPRHPVTTAADVFALRAPAESLASLRQRTRVLPTLNGRSALYLIAQALHGVSKTRVLLPAFHCATVVQPFAAADMEIGFYRVTPRLQVDLDDVAARLDGIDALLLIDFFGFPPPLEQIAAECSRRGVTLIRDCTHSFFRLSPLRLTGARGDLAVFSFWKQVPSRYGGGIRVNTDTLRLRVPGDALGAATVARAAKGVGEEVLQSLSQHAWARALLHLESLRVARHGKIEQATRFAELSVDEAYPFDASAAEARIPWLSRWILSRANLASIGGKRQANYRRYVESLRDYSSALLTPSDCGDVSPYALPILVPDRRRAEERLTAAGVPFFTFGEKLHRLVFERARADALGDARHLADHLLCLSLHQNVTEQAIAGYATAVSETLGP